jgi:predicted nucleic acid-binding protein
MPAVATLIDTGPLVSILGRNDPRHDECLAAFKLARAPLFTCWPVITEVAYLLRHSLPAQKTLFELLRTNALAIVPLHIDDLPAIEAILSKYHDQRFQLADACLMHLAEREGISEVLTLDERDFRVFRTSSGKSLTLLP